MFSRRFLSRLTFGSLLLLMVTFVYAQGEDCPAVITEALHTLDDSCQAVGANEACYGNRVLNAEFWEEKPEGTFSQPADLTGVADLRTLAGNALSPSDGTWGLGLMKLRANIPDTLPGQAITFLLVGETEIENTVTPEDARQPITPIEVTASGGVNLRGGPSTNFNVIASMTPGETLPAIGRNEAGDWLQLIREETQRVWASAGLVNADGDTSTLPVVFGNPQYASMEAFYFKTGLGNLECEEAPPDHILVSSPEGLAVTFNANGVNITMASVGALQAKPGQVMTVTTFEGAIVVEYGGFSITVPPGFEIDIPLGGEDGLEAISAPQNFRPFDREFWIFWELFAQEFASFPPFVIPPEPPPPPPPGQETGPGGAALATGDVQVTLSWDTLADMDLSVTDPLGNTVSYASPVAGAGQLDLDSNFPCGLNTNYVENIFWPEGSAPSGTYSVLVNQFSSCGAADANWTLTVRVGGAVVLQESGTGGTQSFTFSKG